MAKIKRQHIKVDEISWRQAYELYQEEKERYNIAESTLINYRLGFNRWNEVFEIGADATIEEGAAPTYDEFIDALRTLFLNRYDEFAELRPGKNSKVPLWKRIEEL